MATMFVAACAALPGDGRSSVAVALTQSATATLKGTVVDEAGAFVPTARLTALNRSTALQRHATTNDEGAYVIPLLPPGSYSLTVQRDGFTTVEIRNIVLNVNDQLALRVRLKVGEIGESVTVIDWVEGVQESVAVSAMVNRQFIENLPLNGRSFHSLLELAPGTVLTRTSFNEQGQFSVNGQRANANFFMVDGVSANIGVTASSAPGQAAAGSLPALTAFGGTNNLVSMDALEEFRILTSTYSAEFGHAPGAQVAIVTRSGTNEFRGSAFGFVRNDALDANDWFGNSRGLQQPSLRQYDFGGVLGGPIVKDRTFFFFSYEGLRLHQPHVALTEVPSLAMRRSAPESLRPFLNAFPLPNGPEVGNGLAEFSASYSDPSSFNATSLRVDHLVSNSVIIWGRFNRAPSETLQRGGINVPGFNGQSLNTFNRTYFDTRTLTAGATFALTPRVVNDLRVNLSRARGSTTLFIDDFGGATPLPASIIFPPFVSQQDAGFQFILRGGLNSNLGVGKSVDNWQRQVNVVNNLSVVTGTHQLKFGVDYRRLTPVYGPLNYSQSVVFGDGTNGGIVTAINTGRAFQVRILADREPRVPIFTNFSAFAQDTNQLSPRFTVVYGLRWELNPPPAEKHDNGPFAIAGLDGIRDGATLTSFGHYPTMTLAPRGTPLWKTSFTNFAPRVGVAYHLWPRRGTVLRGGGGIFYDLGNGQSAQAFGSVFPYTSEKVLTDVTFPLDPSDATPPPFTLAPPYGTIYSFLPSLKLPRTFQGNATLEQPLGQRQTVSASYVMALGRKLLRETALVNPNPNFRLVRLTTNNSLSDYHALQVRYERRLSDKFQAHAAYTWSHSIDNDSDDSSSILYRNVFNPRQERGPSTFDVRHSLTAAFTYRLPQLFKDGAARVLLRDWSFDSIVRARTATPVNVIARNGTLLGDLVEAQRPDLVQGVPLYLDDANAPGGRRINPAAFVVVNGRHGTLGRNALRGFGFAQIDVALRRRFAVTERVNLQLRAEFFNLLNHPNFGDPVNDLNNRLFGQSVQMFGRSLGTGGVNGGLSPLYQVGGPRSIQLALKLQF